MPNPNDREREIRKLEKALKDITAPDGSPVREIFAPDVEHIKARLAELQSSPAVTRPSQDLPRDEGISATPPSPGADNSVGEQPPPSDGDTDARGVIAEHLQRAVSYVREHRFIDAFNELKQAEKYAAENPQFESQLRHIRTEEVEAPWREWKAKLEQDIQAALALTPLPAEIDSWIENYYREAVRPFPAEVAQRDRSEVDAKVSGWTAEIARTRVAADADRAAAELQASLEQLWQEASGRADVGKRVEARGLSRQALDLANATKTKYPKHAGVTDLWAKARLEDDKAKDLARTGWITVDFEATWHEYSEADPRTFPNLPRYTPKFEAGRLKIFLTEGEKENIALNEGEELLPRDAAIKALERFIVDYAVTKADDKLNLARQALEQAHDPDLGLRYLDEVEEGGKVRFFIPPGREKDTQWAERLKRVRNYRPRVETAVQRRIQAEKIRDSALSESSVVAAWQSLTKARETDPHVELIVEYREHLLPRLIAHLEHEFANAESARQGGDWAQAGPAAEALRKLTQEDNRLKVWTSKIEELIQKCREAERRHNVIVDEITASKKALDGGDSGSITEADGRLAKLEEQLGSDRAAYPEIALLRGRIDARLHQKRAVASAEEILVSPASTAEQLQDEINALSESKDVPEIRRVLERLRARLYFRQAEQERRLVASLKDFDAVRSKYQAVVTLKGDDAPRAQTAIEAMDRDAAESENAQHDVEMARQLIAKEKFDSAYPLLRKWTNRSVIQGAEVAEILQQATNGLVEKLENDLQDMAARLSALDTRAVEQKIEALRQLDPDRARMWEGDLLASCYVQKARRGTAIEALPHWLKAYSVVASDSDLWETVRDGLRESAKAKVFADLALLDGDAAIARLREMLAGFRPDPGGRPELILDYSLDPGVRLSLARRLLTRRDESQRDLELAHEEARRARDLLAVSPGSNAAARGELERLSNDLEGEKRLRLERDTIVERLTPASTAANFAGAVHKANELIAKEEYRDRQRELQEWWGELTNSSMKALEDEWQRLRSAEEQRWKQISVMLKILELRPEDEKAATGLLEAAGRALSFAGKVAAMQSNTTGSAGPRAEDALAGHIRQVELLLEEGRAYKEMFRRHGEKLADDKPSDLDSQVSTTLKWLNALTEFRGRIAEAREVLRQAQRSGKEADWGRVDELIKGMTGSFDREHPERGDATSVRPHDWGTFSNHRTLVALKEDVEKGKKRRAQLVELRSELTEAWRDEDFARVVEIIKTMRAIDPDDNDYGMREGFSLKVEEEVEEGIDKLGELAAKRQVQFTTIQKWADAIELVAPWRPTPPIRIEDPNESNAPATLKERVVEILEQIYTEIRDGNHAQAGSLYANLPEKQSAAPSANPAPSSSAPISDDVAARVKRADFTGAMLICFEALVGGVVDKRLQDPDLFGAKLESMIFKDILEEQKNELRSKSLRKALTEHSNVHQVIVRNLPDAWNQGYRQISGDLIPGRPAKGGQAAWSLKKAQTHFSTMPTKSGEAVSSRKARLALARGLAHAAVVESWIAEVQARLLPAAEAENRVKEAGLPIKTSDSIALLQGEFLKRMADARDFYNLAHGVKNRWGGLGRWSSSNEYNSHFTSCLEALEAAAAICPPDHCQAVQDRYNDLTQLDEKIYSRLVKQFRIGR